MEADSVGDALVILVCVVLGSTGWDVGIETQPTNSDMRTMIEKSTYGLCTKASFWLHPLYTAQLRWVPAWKQKCAMSRILGKQRVVLAYIFFTARLSSSFCVGSAISSIAFSNTSSLTFDGFQYPLTSLTNCNDAVRISSSVTGTSASRICLILLHILCT